MTVTSVVVVLAQVMTLAIILRAILSWFPGARALAPVVAVLDEATTPILRPFRRLVPPLGGLDLSPLLAILLIGVGESLLLGLLARH